MKLISGLKGKTFINLENSSQSQIQSEIENVDEIKTIKKNNESKCFHKALVPIRKMPIPTMQVRRVSKLEEVQIVDQEEGQGEGRACMMIVEEIGGRGMHRDQGNQQTHKKKLVKVSNKCKIQRKQFSSTECGICLSNIESKPQPQIGRLQCRHSFCFDCILESSKFSTRCPYCRNPFTSIKRDNQQIEVDQKILEDQEDVYDQPCYVCGRNDDFDHLLQCQNCQSAFCHTYCDLRLDSDVPPEESWFCLSCENLIER